MTIEDMRKLKKELSLTNAMIAEMAKLPLRTIQKIFSGETKHPRYDTLSALETVFRALDIKILEKDTPLPWYGEDNAAVKKDHYSFRPMDIQTVAEPAWNYGTSALQNPGPFTIDDYHHLPDGERAELIDGQLIYMETPTRIHQLIAGEIHRQIANYIYDNERNDMPGISRMGVQLDRDEKTMVVPDVLVVCDPEKVKGRDVFGAPDFVLEVLSPTTSILDPLAGVLDVQPYGFAEEPALYDMKEPVEVRIYGGKLKIDFKRILPWIEEDREISGKDTALPGIYPPESMKS